MEKIQKIAPSTFFSNFDISNSLRFDVHGNLDLEKPKLVQNLLPKFNSLININECNVENFKTPKIDNLLTYSASTENYDEIRSIEDKSITKTFEEVLADKLDKKFNEFISNEMLKKRRTSYCENYNVNIYNQMIYDNEALISGFDKLKKAPNQFFLKKSSANSLNINVINKMAQENNPSPENLKKDPQFFMKEKNTGKKKIEIQLDKKIKSCEKNKNQISEFIEKRDSDLCNNIRRNSSVIDKIDLSDEPEIFIPKKLYNKHKEDFSQNCSNEIQEN